MAWARPTAASVILRFAVEKAPKRLGHPRIETARHIGTTGCARPLEGAMRIAFAAMIRWLAYEWNSPEPDASLLPGQVEDARCTQVINLE